MHLASLILLCHLMLLFPCHMARSSLDENVPRPPSSVIPRTIYINLRLLYDDALLVKFNNNEHEVHQFLLEVVHSVYLTYNNKPLSYVAEWHFVVQSIDLVKYVTIGRDNDGDWYRKSVGLFFQGLLPDEMFTSLILFTGHNFRMIDSNLTRVLGLAPRFTGCTPDFGPGSQRPTILVKARSYQCASTLAHELAHSLGLHHDEDYQCGPNHIMSQFAAQPCGGKTKFSQCSRHLLKNIFTEIFITSKDLRQVNYKAECFQYSEYKNPVAVFPTDQNHAYKSVSANKQCKYLLGELFEARDMRGWSPNICHRLDCTNQIVNIPAHPALENTTCGPDKYCRAGKCR